MDWKVFIWIFSILGVLIVILISLLFYQGSELGFSSVELEECKVLQDNGGDSINLVFFSSKNEAEKYMNYFLDFKPFLDFKDRFNFFYIDNYQPECEIYKGVAILCYSRDLIKKAGSCPNDYIVVVEDSGASLRSSSYVNVMSINSKHPMSVFSHEFGHVFANFAEEYVPANVPRGSRNCVSNCESFEGKENGCFDGCSRSDFIRSIDNGVMRTLRSEDFGSFNEFVLMERINEESNARGITGKVIDEGRDCGKGMYYLVEGVYNDGSVDFIDKTIEHGCIGDNGYGGFNYRMILDDGRIVNEEEFDPELIFTAGPDEDNDGVLDGEVFESNRNFFLKIPIVDGSKRLEISDESDALLSWVDLYDIGGRLCLVK